jgi:hypothetical protein
MTTVHEPRIAQHHPSQQMASRGLPAGPPTAWQQRIPGPQLPGFVSAVTLIFGVWLLLAPAVWDYGDTGGGFDARWNALLTGLLVTIVGVARLARWIPVGVASLLALLAGGWLFVAPFALAYGFGADSTRATLNDVLIGTTLIVVTLLGHTSARMTVTNRL